MEIGLVDPSILLAADALLKVILAGKSDQSVRMAHKLSITFRGFRGSSNCLSVTAN